MVNAMSPPVPLIPENAPFTPAQRAWLNGFLAGLCGGASAGGLSTAMQPPAEPEDFPWHDPAMELDERMRLAEGQPLRQRLMAAMGQLDCGQCGYLCQSYADGAGRRTGNLDLALRSRCQADGAAAEAVAGGSAGRTCGGASPRVPANRPRGEGARQPQRLPGRDPAKDVRHVVIDLAVIRAEL